jgi:hypothetical protein
VALAALLTAAVSVPAAAGDEPVAASVPGPSDIARAVEVVKADPNLAPDKTIKTLRWKDAGDTKPTTMPRWLAWIGDLFAWLDQSARPLVWCAVALLAGLLVVHLGRLARTRGVSRGEDAFVAPTHVRDLDIRPESLPDDIGGAARSLWDRGERRPALALLYRGMLSRLAHVHRVPVRASTTEGDCLDLAAHHLTQATREYVSRLVQVWQPFVYGGQDAPASTVYGLCDDFSSSMQAVERA